MHIVSGGGGRITFGKLRYEYYRKQHLIIFIGVSATDLSPTIQVYLVGD